MFSRFYSFFRTDNSKKKPKKSFEDRLNKIGYDVLNKIPLEFECGINHILMEEPTYINKNPKDSREYKYGYEEKAIKKWNSVNPSDPITREEIQSINPYTELAEQIECFVSTLETIHALQQQLKELETFSLEKLKTITKDTDITHDELQLLFREQQTNNKQLIFETLIEQLEFFIAFTTSIATKDPDREKKESSEEIENIVTDKRLLLNQLRNELLLAKPIFFPYPYKQPNSLFFSLFHPASPFALSQITLLRNPQPPEEPEKRKTLTFHH